MRFLEASQRDVQIEETRGPRLHDQMRRLQGNPPAAVTLEPSLAPFLFCDEVSHGTTGGKEKVPSILIPRGPLIYQAEIGVMDQSGGLEGAAGRKPGQPGSGEAPEISVDQTQKTRRRAGVPLGDLLKDFGDGAFLRRGQCGSSSNGGTYTTETIPWRVFCRIVGFKGSKGLGERSSTQEERKFALETGEIMRIPPSSALRLFRAQQGDEMKKLILVVMLVAVAAAFGAGSTYAGGNTKIEICHIPPGNPDNFHTIKISENAYSAHLAHGDLGGPCNAACATLCDDGNACTIDDTGDCAEVGCPITPDPVDCNDQNECTNDSCNSTSGCVNTPLLGEICNDDQLCSGPDTCNAQGECQGPAIDSCCLGDEDCSQNLCDQASCNLDTNRCGENPVVCNPPDLCSVSECASDTGECVGSGIVCEEGETCNPANGLCEAASGSKAVFITSVIYPGALGGLSGADDICNQHAADAGLAGSYMAWLSDSTDSPNTRFTQNTGTYVRTDGVQIASNYADLTDGTLAAPINTDEFGSPLPAESALLGKAWSFTTTSGDPIPDSRHCRNWTSGESSDQGLKGNPVSTDSCWTGCFGSSFNCKFQGARLYCFEQ